MFQNNFYLWTSLSENIQHFISVHKINFTLAKKKNVLRICKYFIRNISYIHHSFNLFITNSQLNFQQNVKKEFPFTIKILRKKRLPNQILVLNYWNSVKYFMAFFSLMLDTWYCFYILVAFFKLFCYFTEFDDTCVIQHP